MFKRFTAACDEAPFEMPIALYLGAIGIYGLITGQGVTPESLSNTLPTYLVHAWTLGLAVGGVMTVYGLTRANLRQEIFGLWCLGYGSSLYAGCILVVANFPASVTAMAAMAAIAMGCAFRIRYILKRRKVITAVALLNDGSA